MKITVTSVPVQDQTKALAFYTAVLGFQVKRDIDMGGGNRWLTVVSSDAPDGVELLLEPLGFAPAVTYQKALYDAGIPWTAFGSSDIQAEYEKLTQRGVEFRAPPKVMPGYSFATFEDTCGNLIQLVQA